MLKPEEHLPTDVSPRYHVTHEGVVRGPYQVSFIEAMIESGIFTRDILVWNGEAWVPWSAMDVNGQKKEAEAPDLPPQAFPDSVDSVKNKGD